MYGDAPMLFTSTDTRAGYAYGDQSIYHIEARVSPLPSGPWSLSPGAPPSSL